MDNAGMDLGTYPLQVLIAVLGMAGLLLGAVLLVGHLYNKWDEKDKL